MVILSREQLAVLKSLTPYPLELDSVVLERVSGKARVTLWDKQGRYKVYLIEEGGRSKRDL